VDDHIRLAEQAESTERKKVRRAGAGADKEDGADRPHLGAVERLRESGLRFHVAAGERELGGLAGKRGVEEAAARDRHRIAVHDRGHDKGAELRAIHDVHRDAATPSLRGKRAEIQFRRVCTDGDCHAVEQRGSKAWRMPQQRAGLTQGFRLALDHLALSHEQRGAAGQVQEGREVTHQTFSARGSNTAISGRQEPQPVPARVASPTPDTSPAPQPRIAAAVTP
jgi:hypothetical protein